MYQYTYTLSKSLLKPKCRSILVSACLIASRCFAQTATHSTAALTATIRQLSAQAVCQHFGQLVAIDPAVAFCVPCLPPVGFWEGNRVSSGYGWRRHPISGQHRLHTGIDIAGTYQHIRAAATGVVLQAGYEKRLGNFVRIDHQNGYCTTYGHLASVLVSTGQAVSIGERIGILGKSGAATGLHLHYSVSKNGVAQDPAPYLTLGLQLVHWYQRQAPRNVPTPPPLSFP
jgi:murein DD-endopeptidase MepM/ murein hydrolase activator NlpD